MSVGGYRPDRTSVEFSSYPHPATIPASDVTKITRFNSELSEPFLRN
jgi:hypothetical protein